MKPTLPVFFLAVCMAWTLVACERTPGPTAPAPKPTAGPTQSAPPSTTTEHTTEPAAKPGEQTESWVLPGSLGPLTTQLELEIRFGKANLRAETFTGPEGDGTYPVRVVFPNDPRKRLELIQEADNPDAPIQELRVSSLDSLWHDSEGLRNGMSLSELVALNGAPVSFYGLDWDYGGTIQDWHGGKLANAVDARLFHRVTLAARKGAGKVRLPQGDASFRSDDAGYPTIGKDLVVGQLGISWPHEGED